MKIHVSKKNSKLGKVHSISLPPILACLLGIPCARRCYAMKAYRLRPNVRDAWDENLDFVIKDMAGYFAAIADYIRSNTVKLFRWHVGGDIQGQKYFDGMVAIAKEFPAVKFLAFTKVHNLDFSASPENLAVVASMWVNWGDETIALPKAWYQDGNETRVPDDALICTGGCDKCGLCWDLPSLGKDVVFHAH